MAYVSSGNIQIFPIANRTTQDPLGRLTTEYNLTSILNKLLDVNGFVVSWDNTNKIIIFNLHGYLITANLKDIIDTTFGSSSDIYASISIADYSGEGVTDYEKKFLAQLNGSDSGSEYTGVTFSSSEPTPSQTDIIYPLHLLTKVNDGTWVIPEDSKIKFKTNAYYRSISIDDGII